MGNYCGFRIFSTYIAYDGDALTTLARHHVHEGRGGFHILTLLPSWSPKSCIAAEIYSKGSTNIRLCVGRLLSTWTSWVSTDKWVPSITQPAVHHRIKPAYIYFLPFRTDQQPRRRAGNLQPQTRSGLVPIEVNYVPPERSPILSFPYCLWPVSAATVAELSSWGKMCPAKL